MLPTLVSLYREAGLSAPTCEIGVHFSTHTDVFATVRTTELALTRTQSARALAPKHSIRSGACLWLKERVIYLGACCPSDLNDIHVFSIERKINSSLEYNLMDLFATTVFGIAWPRKQNIYSRPLVVLP